MRQCVSHHYACDCREANFEKILIQMAKYKAALYEISSTGDKASSKLAQKVLNEIRDEVRERRQNINE